MRFLPVILALLVAGCSAQTKRKQITITVLGSNSYEFAGNVLNIYRLGDALQDLDDSKYGLRTDIRIVAQPTATYEWIHAARLSTCRMPRSGNYYLATNATEQGQFFFDGSPGDGPTWKTTEINLPKGNIYFRSDDGSIQLLEDPDHFWSNTNFGHCVYIISSPTTTVQQIIQELTVVNKYDVLPFLLHFDIISDEYETETN